MAGPALDLPADPLPPPLPGVARIAVLRAAGIGDHVVAEPALSALREAYPQAEITLLGAAHVRPLVEGRPGPCDRFVEVPLVPGVRVRSEAADAAPEVVEAWCAEQRDEGYDLAVQLHGGGRTSTPLLQRLGARVTAGAATPDAPRPDLWVPYTDLQHDTLRWLEVVAAVGAGSTRWEPHLAVTAADLDASRAVVAPGRAPLAVVHPGATDPRRCWPEDRLGAVAAALRERGARVVVAGGPSDADRVTRVAEAAGGHVETVVGGLGLGGLVGLLRRATLVVGNDSGPRHLAGAVGTPTVGVFTNANLADVVPLSRTWHRVAVDWRSACEACGTPVVGGHCDHGVSALGGVTVDQVRALALELWDQAVEAGRTTRDGASAPTPTPVVRRSEAA